MKFASLLFLSLFYATAFSAEMKCQGVTNEGRKYSVNFDFNEMSVSINGEKSLIQSSDRSNSYRRGTQFLVTQSQAGSKVTAVRSSLVHASYYSTGTKFDNSISFTIPSTNEQETAWLSCTPAIYNGPTSFKR